MGVVGAAAATALAETLAGVSYLKLLSRRKLVSVRKILKPPAWASVRPLIFGGAALLGRQMAINVGIVAAARQAQILDPTHGVAAAAYGIVMQFYTVGIVVHVAVQGAAAALVSSALARDGKDVARVTADRIFVWGAMVGVLLGLGQFLAVPYVVPHMSTLPAVQNAVWKPALLVTLMHIVNGFVFAGEGVLLGLSQFRTLLQVNAAGVALMVAFLNLSPLGSRLDGILWCMLSSNALQAVAIIVHYLRIGPLANNQADRIEVATS
jgi:Na+-driven multidrug efflux pump